MNKPRVIENVPGRVPDVSNVNDAPRTTRKTDWHAEARDVVRTLQQSERSRFTPPPVSRGDFPAGDLLPSRVPALEPSFRPLPEPVEMCASEKEFWLGVRKINVTVLHACQEKFDELPELPNHDAHER